MIYDKKVSDIESYLRIRRNYLDKNRMVISYSYYGIPASIWTFKSKQMDILSELLVLEGNNESTSLDLKICDTDIQLGSMKGIDSSHYDCIRDGYVNSISRNNESIKSLKSEFVRNSLYNRFSNGFITCGELVLKEDDNSKCSDIDMVFKVVC